MTALYTVTCLLFAVVIANILHISTSTISLELLPAHQGHLFKLKRDDGTEVLNGHVGRGSSNANVKITQEGSCKTVTTIGLSVDDIIEDCFALEDAHWYGGPEQYRQYWPLDDVKFSDYSYVTKEVDHQGIAERYWLSSKGVYIYVHENVPLFIDMNSDYTNTLCFRAKSREPYATNVEPVLSYDVCTYENAREAHENAILSVFGKPSDHPDQRMIRYPIWSTWAKYKANINETTVLELADQITENGFKNSQLEIDDDWEICYGALTFRESKFPNPKNLINTLKEKGYRVTLWVHPFINVGCDPWYEEATNKGYFVTNLVDNSTNTSWWNGVGGIIDFTNEEAVNWYVSRLHTLQDENGLDSLKFDAGETGWLPQPPRLHVSPYDTPNLYTKNYVNELSKFGNMIEVRVGQHSQNLPMFIRMIDKDSRWTWENGLKTLVTTLLMMNMVGYPFVLPDLIGGDGYGEVPSKELLIRWVEATVFMPALQFSFLPWDYDEETVALSRKYSELHAQYADKIIELAVKTTQDGSPINPPIWWIDPTDETAQIIESEFLLGEDILVAPVLDEGAVSRDIYLPKGEWQDELRSERITGPIWLRNYAVALDELAYFTRVSA